MRRATLKLGKKHAAIDIAPQLCKTSLCSQIADLFKSQHSPTMSTSLQSRANPHEERRLVRLIECWLYIKSRLSCTSIPSRHWIVHRIACCLQPVAGIDVGGGLEQRGGCKERLDELGVRICAGVELGSEEWGVEILPTRR